MKPGSLVTFKNPYSNEIGQVWQIIEIRGDQALCQWINSDMILLPTNDFLLSDLVLIKN